MVGIQVLVVQTLKALAAVAQVLFTVLVVMADQQEQQIILQKVWVVEGLVVVEDLPPVFQLPLVVVAV
jgi:hypothetical protein